MLKTESYTYAKPLMQQWMERSPDAQQLSDSAPILLWLLLARHQMNGWPESHIEMLLRSPRTKILSAVSGIEQRAALRWLARVSVNEGSQQEHELLVNALRAGLHQTRWAYEASIPMHWIRGALAYLEVSNSRAFHALCRQYPNEPQQFLRDLDEQARFWSDALQVAKRVNIPDAEVALNRCTDFSGVRRLHDRWTDRLNQSLAQVVEGATAFPPAPLPGTTDIHPISSLEDLQAEGRLMHHCVSVYEHKIQRGGCYVYRILRPERATIELELHGKLMRVGHLSLAYNATPSQATVDAVNHWLSSVRHPASSFN